MCSALRILYEYRVPTLQMCARARGQLGIQHGGRDGLLILPYLLELGLLEERVPARARVVFQ